jgi:alpha-glucosidase (family GH31 glycosyl hydrolase)
MRSLIPNMLNLSMTGHPFACPDMIGGGLASDFTLKPQARMDSELFARWSECSALMPMMQYSYPVWSLKNKKIAEICRNAAFVHEAFAPFITKCAEEAKTNGLPIVRPLAFDFPDDENVYTAVQQFTLGGEYLVAPVTQKGLATRTVYLPKGASYEYIPQDFSQKEQSTNPITTYTGGETVTVNAPLNILPVFKIIKSRH